MRLLERLELLAMPLATHQKGQHLELGARILQLLGGGVDSRLGQAGLLLGCNRALVLRGRLLL